MALARKRDWYFQASWFWTIVWAALTLGIARVADAKQSRGLFP